MRPPRTPAGDAFTDLVVSVAVLGGRLTAHGEQLAALGGQTLARWVVLDAAEDRPSTVAQIARRRGYARQSVQRVADLLVRDGLARYEDNPEHARAKLLTPTAAGRAVLRTISVAQTAWSDALGAAFGPTELPDVMAAIARISHVLDVRDQPRPSEGPVDR